MKTSKFTEVKKTDYVDDYGNHNANVKFENGDEGLLSFKPENLPQVGQEFEYEIEEKTSKKGNKWFKIKRHKPKTFGGGNYKKPTVQLKDVLGMVRSNAIHAMVTVNATYNKERITSKELPTIEQFTLADINGEIEKFSDQDRLLTSRLAAVNNAAIASGYKSNLNASELVKLAEAFYSYTTK